MKKLISVLILTLIVELAFGQYTGTITSSRPGQAFTPFSVGKNVLQVQSGFNTSGLHTDDLSSELDVDAINYSALFRYGVHERIEIRSSFGISRLDFEFKGMRLGSQFPTPEIIKSRFDGVSSFSLGTKINIIDGAAMNPNVAIQVDFLLPVIDEDFRNDKVATNLILAHTQGITENIGLSTNLGAIWGGNGSSADGFYAINLGFSLPANFGTFIEAYGAFDTDDFDILFDTGIRFLVNDNLLLDVSGGYGSNDEIEQYFVDFGVSWRTRFGS